jgi:hypothetical protein
MLHRKEKKKDNWWDFGTKATSDEQRAKPGERDTDRQAGRRAEAMKRPR